jgi:hypothetical protein
MGIEPATFRLVAQCLIVIKIEICVKKTLTHSFIFSGIIK